MEEEEIVGCSIWGPCLLTQVQESIFQISLDFLLDALQHVIRAVALVPFEY